MNPQLIIVDDDEVLLMILKKIIQIVNPKRKLTMFSSGQKALDRLAELDIEKENRFILLDINLKDMSGWDFLKELEARNDQYSKVIMITSSVSKSNAIFAKEHSSVIAFFEKPITFDIINNIESIIEANTSHS